MRLQRGLAFGWGTGPLGLRGYIMSGFRQFDAGSVDRHAEADARAFLAARQARREVSRLTVADFRAIDERMTEWFASNPEWRADDPAAWDRLHWAERAAMLAIGCVRFDLRPIEQSMVSQQVEACARHAYAVNERRRLELDRPRPYLNALLKDWSKQ